MEALADATLAPMLEVWSGRAWWLRVALFSHLLATAAATGVAWRLDLGDWQLYLAVGVTTFILVGNFMRWHRRAGIVRRSIGTLAALVVVIGWTLLLLDRARSDWDARLYRPATATLGDFAINHAWFWLPVALYLLCAALLVGHLFGGRVLRRAR